MDNGLPLPVERGNWMTRFYFYGDESGRADKADWISFCGFVGASQEWEHFAWEWEQWRMRWQLPPLHMREIFRADAQRKGPWDLVKTRYPNDESWEVARGLILNEAAKLVLQSNLNAVGALVNSKHFRSMPDSRWKRDNACDPLYMALYHAVMSALCHVATVEKHGKIAIVIDEDREKAAPIYDLLSRTRQANPDIGDRIISICFADDAEFPGIQTADMLSYFTRRLKLENQPDASDIYFHLTRWLTNQPQVYDSRQLDAMASSSRVVAEAD